MLAELDLQSVFEDMTLTRKVGKQLGASAVMTARLVEDGHFLSVHVRLINVETGEVLLAASQKSSGRAGSVLIEPGDPRQAPRHTETTSDAGNRGKPDRAPTESRAAGAPSAADSATPAVNDSRERWLNESYNTTVRYLKDKKVWEEVDNKTGRVIWVDKEVERTTDYIELFSPERKSEIRLLKERMEQKLGGKWGWVANGHWVMPGK